MATTYTYEAKTVASGQRSGGTYLKLVTTLNSITVSGTSATANLNQKLYIKRGDGYTTYSFTGTGSVYLNGVADSYSYNFGSSGVGSSYVCIYDKNRTVTYAASSSKTITMAATFTHSSSSASSFLKGLGVPSSYYTYGGTYTVTSGSVSSITLAAQVSACGAASSLKINNSTSNYIAGRYTDVTLSWTAGTAGTSNAIKEYAICRATSSSGIYSLLGTSVTTSFTVKSGATAGTTYYYKIITVGNVSGYDSGYSTVSPALISNTNPNVPTYTYTNTAGTGKVIPASGGTVTITVTAGASNDSGQSSYAEYSVNNINWDLVTGTLSTDLARTYYFRTNDGINTSSTTTLTITKNATPTISGTATATDTPSNNNQISKIVNLSFSNLTSGDVVKLYIRRGTSDSSLGNYELISTMTASSTTHSVDNFNIPSNCTTKDFFGKYYQLYATASDTYDTSAYKPLTLKNRSGATLSSLYFGSFPTFEKLAYSGSGTTGYFYNSISASYSINPIATSYITYGTSSTNTSSSNLSSLGATSTSSTISNMSSKTTEGSTYYFFIKSTIDSQTVYSSSKTLIRTSTFGFTNILRTGSTCYVIEDESGQNEASQVFSFSTSITNANCLDEFSTTETNDLKWYISYNEISYEITGGSYSYDSSTASLTIPNEDLYDYTLTGGANPFNLSFGSSYTVYIYATVTNSFGVTSTSSYLSMTLDLTYQPKLFSSNSFKISLSTNSNDGFGSYSNSDLYLNEGDQIKFSFGNIKSRTSNNITSRVYLGEYTTNSSNVTYSNSSIATYTTTGSISENTLYPTEIYTIPYSSDVKRLKFKIVHTDSVGGVIEEENSFGVNVNQNIVSTASIVNASPVYDTSGNITTVSSIKTTYQFNSIGGKSYSNYTGSAFDTAGAYDRIDVYCKTANGNTSLQSFYKNATTGQLDIDNLLTNEYSINIIPTTNEISSGQIVISLYALAYVSAEQFNNAEDYYTPVRESQFSNTTLFISLGVPFAIRPGGASINTELESDEAFAVGQGLLAKTHIGFHNLNARNIVINCGTW